MRNTIANRRLIAGLCVSLAILLGLAVFVLEVRDNHRRSLQRPLPSAVGKLNPPVLPAEPHLCPQAGMSVAPESRTGTSHHTVYLSWIASAQSDDPIRNPLGYCLYRSTTKKKATEWPTCFDCERVNSEPIPVSVTNCVDALVDDKVTYHYVVTALNMYGTLSSASNEATVKIPDASRVNPPHIQGLPARSCRGAFDPR